MVINTLDETSLKAATQLRDSVFTHLEKYERDTLSASVYRDEYAKWYAKAGIKQLAYWVAVDDASEEMAGLVGLYTEEQDDDDMLWLGWFCVDPKYRGQKIGSMLLELAIAHVKEQGKKYLHLYTTGEMEYASARALYGKRGFVKYKVEGEVLYYKLKI